MSTELTRNEPIVFHFRLGEGKETQPKTGATVVFLPEEKKMGIALCCAKDRYSRQWGRKIATLRAKIGEQSRIRNRRFNSTKSYTGSLEYESIKEAALTFARDSAGMVANPMFFDMLDEDIKPTAAVIAERERIVRLYRKAFYLGENPTSSKANNFIMAIMNG